MRKYIALIQKYEKQILLAVFLLGIGALFWTFLAHFGLGESGYNFLGKTKKITLSSEAPVSQTFTARQNNLHQVRFVLGNAELYFGERIELRLADETCTHTIASRTLSREPTRQGAFTVFSFPAIANSQGQRYCFIATYFSPENRKGYKPYLSATDEPDPVFSDRTLTDTRKERVYAEQTLFLRPAYTSGSLASDAWQFIERLSQYKPAFLKGWPIVILFGILFLGSITLAFRVIFTGGSREHRP
jgi:hypothetical protein